MRKLVVILSIIAAFVLLGLLARLMRRPAATTGRCPECGHELPNVASPRCPACGENI